MKFVDLTTAKKQLRMTHDEDDTIIEIYLEAAGEMILNYLGVTESEYYDTNLELDENLYPFQAKAATLLLVTNMYEAEEVFKDNYLPPAVLSLLYPLRDPVFE